MSLTISIGVNAELKAFQSTIRSLNPTNIADQYLGYELNAIHYNVEK